MYIKCDLAKKPRNDANNEVARLLTDDIFQYHVKMK